MSSSETAQVSLASARARGASGDRSGHHSFPTFIGIGSMRCGSTWLYQVLQCHPDIRMGDLKEVDFFFFPRMLRHDLRWYESLFAPQNDGPKPIRGEISPRYARLKAWQVKRIAKLLPDLRIILTLRHPIERMWSQTVYDFGRLGGRDMNKVKISEFLRQLERARAKLSGDYFRTVKIWSEAFGREAVHIGFFDLLRNDPQAYIDGVLKHLGASTPWTIPPLFVKKKVWATNALVNHERKIPEVIEWYIADQLLESTERLNEYLNGRVTHWVDEMRTIRDKRRMSWRVLKQINRLVLSAPENLAYKAYHALLDARFRLRWREFATPFVAGNRKYPS